MALPESTRLRMRVDALTWRLKEANEDLEQMRMEATHLEQTLTNARVASLLGEEGADDVIAFSARSDRTLSSLETEESLVRALEQRQREATAHYRRALSKEWAQQIVRRMQQLSGGDIAPAGD